MRVGLALLTVRGIRRVHRRLLAEFIVLKVSFSALILDSSRTSARTACFACYYCLDGGSDFNFL
jgi:hypothetical protein